MPNFSPLHVLPPTEFHRVAPDARTKEKIDEARTYVDATRHARNAEIKTEDAIRIGPPSEAVVTVHPASGPNLLSADQLYANEPLLATRSTLAELFDVPETMVDYLAFQQNESGTHFNIVHVEGVDLSNAPTGPTIRYTRIKEMLNAIFDDPTVAAGLMQQNYRKNRCYFHKEFNGLDINNLVGVRIEKSGKNSYELVSYQTFKQRASDTSITCRAATYSSPYWASNVSGTWINPDPDTRKVHATFSSYDEANQLHQKLCDMASAV
jgi:hypothetical protein